MGVRDLLANEGEQTTATNITRAIKAKSGISTKDWSRSFGPQLRLLSEGHVDLVADQEIQQLLVLAPNPVCIPLKNIQ